MMLTFITTMVTLMVISICELVVLKLIMPPRDPGPELAGFMFNGIVPLVDGVVAFSAVWVGTRALSWFDHGPSLALVILVGVFLLPGRIKQMGAQSSVGASLAIILHVMGTVLGGNICAIEIPRQ
jgi:hypothetical protein